MPVCRNYDYIYVYIYIYIIYIISYIYIYIYADHPNCTIIIKFDVWVTSLISKSNTII